MYRTKHADAIRVDSQILLEHSASFACAISRGLYYPLADAEFSAAGCLDAPQWIPTGACGQWFHNAGHVGMIVVCRDEA